MSETRRFEPPDTARRTARVAARGVAWVSGLFSVIVATLLVANVVQQRSVDPLDNPALETLREALRGSPDDESLAEDIRVLDLMARKAYFTRRWQVHTGVRLLLGGVVILLVSAGVLLFVNETPPRPAPPADRRSALRGQLAVAAFAALAVLSAGVLGAVWSGAEALSGIGAGGGEEPAPSEKEMARNWPFFRGFEAGRRESDERYPTRWDGPGGLGIVWKAALPRPGFNSPVIWENRLFLSGADEDTREIFCFDASTGGLLWTRSVEDVPGSPAEAPTVTEDTGYAAPGLAVDGKRVYGLFANGDLACLDMNGGSLWLRNLGVPDNRYGHSSSLLLHRNLLLVQYDHGREAGLMALDGATGGLVWETPRDVAMSWASPILIDVEDRTLVVLNGSPYVAAYDVETGEEAWRAGGMTGEVAPSPAAEGGVVFALNQYSILMALDGATGELLWDAWEDLPDVSSPAAGRSRLFTATSYGVVSCRSTADGELLWRREFRDGFYSSPILADEMVYLLDRRGVMRILRTDDGSEVVEGSPLGEASDCTPAFVEGRIYIRGVKNLYCIGDTREDGE